MAYVSPTLKAKVSSRIRQWFPRWHSYSLVGTFDVMTDWPDDPGLRPALWRGLHDEYFEVAQAAARTIGRRFAGQSEVADALCKLIASPPSVATAAAAIRALWCGWPQHPELSTMLDEASKSDSDLIAIAGIRGRIVLGNHNAEDFEHLMQLAARDIYTLNDLIGEAMVAGWAGDERLRTFALHETANEHGRAIRRIRPDFGLLINGFPGDREVAALIASDFANVHPTCIFERDDLHALVKHFKSDPVIVPALETWVMQHRPDDAYTLAHAARVAPTATLKSALIKCVKGDHLVFWAASALVDLWGAQDAEVHSALLSASGRPLEQRQNIAHVLPFVMADKAECRRLLLEVVAADDHIRADFALGGLRNLGLDASDRDAVDRVLARGYDDERFVVENEAREVIATFHQDPRVAELAKRQLRQTSGVIDTIASVFANDAEMRRLVLDVATPLDLQMRLTIFKSLASRPGADEESRALISAARKEEAGEVIIAASIKLAQDNRETNQVSAEYLTETQRELDAIGPKMDARRQAALGTLAAVKRLDLLPVPNPLSGLHGIGLHKHRETLRFSAAEWETLAEALGGDEAVLVALGIERKNFLEVFGNDLNASGAMPALRSVLDSASAGATAAAIRFAEHCRPRSGFYANYACKA